MQILATDYRDPNADEVLVRSLRETGFAVLTNHPLTEERLGPLYDAWKAFFYGEDKHAYRFDRDNPTGSREGWWTGSGRRAPAASGSRRSAPSRDG